MQVVRLEFCPTPYTFVAVPGFTKLWDAPDLSSKGVYLWTIEHGDAYLVNYAGITQAIDGFGGRIKKEWKQRRAGLYAKGVDVEQFKAGKRVLRPDKNPAELAAQWAEVEPLYRIFLAPTKHWAIGGIENYIVHTLMQHAATAQFVSNGRPEGYKRPTQEIEIAPTVPLIGLTAPIPETLLCSPVPGIS